MNRYELVAAVTIGFALGFVIGNLNMLGWLW